MEGVLVIFFLSIQALKHLVYRRTQRHVQSVERTTMRNPLSQVKVLSSFPTIPVAFERKSFLWISRFCLGSFKETVKLWKLRKLSNFILLGLLVYTINLRFGVCKRWVFQCELSSQEKKLVKVLVEHIFKYSATKNAFDRDFFQWTNVFSASHKKFLPRLAFDSFICFQTLIVNEISDILIE